LADAPASFFRGDEAPLASAFDSLFEDAVGFGVNFDLGLR